MPEKCGLCKKKGIKQCSRCKQQFYCSKECQTQDWRVHKKICREVAKVAELDRLGPHRGMDGSSEEKDVTAAMLSRISGFTTAPALPEYHKEYRKLYPAERTNFEKLRDNWSMTKMQNESIMEDMTVAVGRDYGFHDLMKRWNYFGPELVEFLESNPTPGDIFSKRIIRPQGTSTFVTPSGVADRGPTKSQTIYQTMRNTPVPPVEFHFGQTYVSIGFVDMFQLLVGSYVDTEDKTSPLIFVGYDKSEVVIARSLIIYEMMQQGVCPESILQVWFSTGWNDKTLRDFQNTIRSLLEEKGSQIEENVHILIRHWLNTKMTARAVLPLWRQLITERFLDPMDNLTFERDRMDYARYIFTGHIFGKKDKDYIHGNVTMFSLPEELNYYFRQDESIFAATALKDLSYKTSLMKTICTRLQDSLVNLCEYVRNNRLICSFLLRDINLNDPSTLEEIRELDAKMIDWSNIPDYLYVNDFFRMARACDGTNTTHFLHSINWQGRVFGVSLMDYPDKVEIYRDLKRQIAERYEKLRVDRPYMRQDQYLIYYLNAADQMLAIRYRKGYVDYFTEGQDVVVSEPNSDEFNPFQRSNCCFFLSFSFKK